MTVTDFIAKWAGVTGGAERAEEEKAGKVRWLRHDCQIAKFGDKAR